MPHERFYAHTRGPDPENWQRLADHLNGVAQLARTLGADTGLADFAALAAQVHDLGKYSPRFQERLKGSKQRVDHKTPGALELVGRFASTGQQAFLARLLAYAVIGHHSGLPDSGDDRLADEGDATLAGHLKRRPDDYQAYASEVDLSGLVLPARLPVSPLRGVPGFSLSFAARMIYSTLVDADYLDTETFINGGEKPRAGYPSINDLSARFTEFLGRFDHPQTEIDRRRSSTLQECNRGAALPPGLFTLTLPTGAGKTFASMAFALRHAAEHGLKRIVYVIPYTSIIEQNAAQFKRALGEDAVLEHHSNFDWSRDAEDEDAGSLNARLKLAAENWDIPIVVTTNVQFFESLFSNRPARSRKVHNLAKSVILFDEAQLLPRDYLRPCLYAVAELVKNYGASAVFLTATQPCVERFLPPNCPVHELIANPGEQYRLYKRVQVQPLGAVTDEEMALRLNREAQALCVVNTRAHARGLFGLLEGEGAFHLSTLMCAAHRSQVVGEIRARLLDGRPCRLVSTQLIEAGVDLDFPVGYRALAGIDSINQAAGRVNRNQARPQGRLFVFEPVSGHIRRVPAEIGQASDVTKLVLRRYAEDLISTEAVRAYYDELYGLHDPNAFDAKRILHNFEKDPAGARFDFKTAAENFRLIETDTMPVIIPFDSRAAGLVNRLRGGERSVELSRAFQPYTVSIYEPEFQRLLAAGHITAFDEAFFVLNERGAYDPNTGLVIPVEGGQGILF